MIKCPECKKDVSESAAACPSCGHPVAQTVNAPAKEKENLEKKKGCGGCLVVLGILILIAGLGTFFGARKSADDLIQMNYENRGIEGVAADDALAKAAGEGSYSDYLAKGNRKSGLIFTVIGIVVAVGGYQMFKGTDDKKEAASEHVVAQKRPEKTEVSRAIEQPRSESVSRGIKQPRSESLSERLIPSPLIRGIVRVAGWLLGPMLIIGSVSGMVDLIRGKATQDFGWGPVLLMLAIGGVWTKFAYTPKSKK